jgi:hypothetical protein
MLAQELLLGQLLEAKQKVVVRHRRQGFGTAELKAVGPPKAMEHPAAVYRQ